MVLNTLGKVYLVLLVCSSHLALYSCQMSGGECPKVPSGFVDPMKFAGKNDTLMTLAKERFAWSSSAFQDFLAFSAVLFTIAENFVVVGMVLYAPFWFLERIIGKTLSAALFGGMVMLIIMHGVNHLPVDFVEVQDLVTNYYYRYMYPAISEARLTAMNNISNISS